MSQIDAHIPYVGLVPGRPMKNPSVSLPRDRFWDIQVSKIDSPTRQPLLPRPSCVRAASPHLRKLGAGYAALPQMTGRDFSYAYFVSPLRYRTPDKQCGPGRYRGLTAFASLSMAVSERKRQSQPRIKPRKNGDGQEKVNNAFKSRRAWKNRLAA
ncbi:hypothetical protein [Thiolapillus sp.]|uniref:hypothetical protein n=1 Tax=Thiolapillus sp. TaxID=2017437 RepID=UPI003AF7AC37